MHSTDERLADLLDMRMRFADRTDDAALAIRHEMLAAFDGAVQDLKRRNARMAA